MTGVQTCASDLDGTSEDEECPTQIKRRRKSKRKQAKKQNDWETGSLDFFTDDDGDITCDDEDSWSDAGDDGAACCECKDPAEKSKLIRYVIVFQN